MNSPATGDPVINALLAQIYEHQFPCDGVFVLNDGTVIKALVSFWERYEIALEVWPRKLPIVDAKRMTLTMGDQTWIFLEDVKIQYPNRSWIEALPTVLPLRLVTMWQIGPNAEVNRKR